MGATASARRVTATVASDSPICAILPSSRSSLSFAYLVLQRDVRVDAVQLKQRDLLKAKGAQAPLALLAQVLGPPVRPPHARAGPGQARLGGDDEVGRVGVQRLPDQLLGDGGPV